MPISTQVRDIKASKTRFHVVLDGGTIELKAQSEEEKKYWIKSIRSRVTDDDIFGLIKTIEQGKSEHDRQEAVLSLAACAFPGCYLSTRHSLLLYRLIFQWK